MGPSHRIWDLTLSVHPHLRGLSPLLIVVVACTDHDGVWRPVAEAKGPHVAVVDSVQLTEPDSAQLGAFTSFFARSGQGEVFVVDGDRGKVSQFDRSGAFIGTFGQHGTGPGEFELPGVVMVLPGDSILVVDDVNRRRLQLFRIGDRRPVREVLAVSQDLGANWLFDGDTARFALHVSPQLLGAWVIGDSVSTGSGTLPARLLAAPGALMRHGRSTLVRTDLGLAVFLPTVGGLMLLDSNGSERGVVRLPAARRLGEPEDLLARVATQGRAPGDRAVIASSADGAHRLSSGAILLVHLDMAKEGMAGTSGRFGNFRLFASILRPDLTAACVDAEIPVTSDVAPIPVFHGDTMFVLARRVTSTDKVRSLVYAVTFDDTGCQWIPTGGLTPPPESSGAPAR